MAAPTETYGAEANGDPLRGEFEIARALLDGADWRDGLAQLEALAQRGSLPSTLCVAGRMLDGWGYDEDLPGAEAWYGVAVEAGSTAGLFGLVLTHLRMGLFEKAAEKIREAVAKNYKPAYNALAYLYSRGKGVPHDRAKALSLWKAGAQQGHLEAKRGETWALLHGHGGLRGRLKGILSVVPLAFEIARAKRVASEP